MQTYTKTEIKPSDDAAQLKKNTLAAKARVRRAKERATQDGWTGLVVVHDPEAGTLTLTGSAPETTPTDVAKAAATGGKGGRGRAAALYAQQGAKAIKARKLAVSTEGDALAASPPAPPAAPSAPKSPERGPEATPTAPSKKRTSGGRPVGPGSCPQRGKGGSRPVGVKSGEGIQKTWLGYFEAQARKKSDKRLTLAAISAAMKAEFPTRDSAVFDRPAHALHQYNTGMLSGQEGEKPAKALRLEAGDS